MSLADRIHKHLDENVSHVSFELELLAFTFAGDDVADIERALGQLVREGRAVKDADGWTVGPVTEASVGSKQRALFT